MSQTQLSVAEDLDSKLKPADPVGPDSLAALTAESRKLQSQIAGLVKIRRIALLVFAIAFVIAATAGLLGLLAWLSRGEKL